MKRWLLLFALLATAGCTTKTIPGPLVVSTRPLPEMEGSAPRAKRVRGQSCERVVLLLIPVGFATVKSAYEDALAEAPGTDTLIDYQERVNGLFLFPFYHQLCTEVHGYAVSSKAAANQPPPK